MPATNRKDVLTTGEVARICHVAPRTVSKWFDTGQLRGYRIPGSRDRRIPREQLLAFMRAHGLPLGELDDGDPRVMVLHPDVPQDLIDTVRAVGRYEIRTAQNEFEAGVLAQRFRPHVVVVRVRSRGEDAGTICHNIKQATAPDDTRVIATAPDLTDGQVQWLLAQGFDGCLGEPYSAGELVDAIDEAVHALP